MAVDTEKLADELRPFAAKPVGSIRIDVREVAKIVAALDELAALRRVAEPVGEDRVEVRQVETVTGDFLTEPGEPFWRLGHDGDGADPSLFRAQVIVPTLGGTDGHGRALGTTPALALCAASLRARAEEG